MRHADAGCVVDVICPTWDTIYAAGLFVRPELRPVPVGRGVSSARTEAAMPAVHDDQTGRLDRIDNELAVARGLREIAWLNRDDAYEHYELVIEGLVLLRADAERLPTVRDIIDRGGVLP